MSRPDDFLEAVTVVLTFASKLKSDMLRAGLTRGRRRCPLHEASGAEHWIHARISGSRNHLSMGCDDPKCRMRMIE